MANHILDEYSIAALFAFTLLLLLCMQELGFRYGQTWKVKKVKAQTAQVRALMTATLGLLAFMLAFTFSAAQTHFENRIQLQVDESMLAKNAFMQADLMQEPFRSRARDLLIRYVECRLNLQEMVRKKDQEEIVKALDCAEEIHMALWAIVIEAKSLAAGGDIPQHFGGDLNSIVLGLMDLHTLRVQAALKNRIPPVIWFTLYFTAVIAMIVVGYQAGLTEKRSPLATFSLALSFSAVMILIMDLDRPLQSFFTLDITVLQQLAEFMRSLV